MKKIIGLLVLAVLLAGCSPDTEIPAGPVAPQTVQEPVQAPEEASPAEEAIQEPEEEAEAPEIIQVEAEAAAMAPPPNPAVPVILECEAPGTLEERCDSAVVDYSNSSDGYVMVQFTGETNSRLKVRVQGPRATYTYNLPVGQWTVFPLSDGSGSYKVSVYMNVSGSQYATVMSAQMEVALTDEFAPFLRPNQYVDYSCAPNTMALGQELCAGIEAPLEKVAAVYDYVVDNFTYDYNKAATVQSGYLPVLDSVLEVKTGICFDYAAVMAAMLRSQEVPCKLVVGYAGSAYHAWISVWTEENGWVDGAIFFDGQTWKRMDPTFASSSGRSEKILNFIETGSYTEKYLY